LAIVPEQPWYLRIAAAREFSGRPRDFSRGSRRSCAEKCRAQAQIEYETGTPGINSVRADLSGASARKILTHADTRLAGLSRPTPKIQCAAAVM
jgi:hypothetical protein